MASNRLVLETINRLSELLEENAAMIRPRGTLPSYVEFTKEQWERYERNRQEQQQLLRELRNLSY
jgi:hypothetical protein